MNLFRVFIEYEKTDSRGVEENIGLYKKIDEAKKQAEFANASRKGRACVEVFKNGKKEYKKEYKKVGIWILKKEWEYEDFENWRY